MKGKSDKNWLTNSIEQLNKNFRGSLKCQKEGGISTISLRAYGSEKEEYKYGWSRTIPYFCHKYNDNFNYKNKIYLSGYFGKDNFYINNVGISFAMKTQIFNSGIKFIASSTEDYNILNVLRENNNIIMISPYIRYIVNDNNSNIDTFINNDVVGNRILLNIRNTEIIENLQNITSCLYYSYIIDFIYNIFVKHYQIIYIIFFLIILLSFIKYKNINITILALSLIILINTTRVFSITYTQYA